MSKRNANSGGSGCLGFFVFVIFIAFAMTIYSYFWIPAIPIMIYLAKSKKFAEKRANFNPHSHKGSDSNFVQFRTFIF